MSYKDLLVHLDESKGCAQRVDAAVRLAASHGAHLTGFYPMVEIPLLNAIRERIPRDIQAAMDAAAQARAEAALESFREAAERGGIAYETRTDQALDTTLAHVLGMHARYADLAVLGQVDPNHPAYAGGHLPEEVVLASGRPLLVVPQDWAPGPLGERVLIAWDASREAARAVSDALPILEQAATVLVVSVNPKSTPLGHGEVPGADIAVHLARHGVEVEVRSIELEQIEVGEALLSFAADGARDLLVAEAGLVRRGLVVRNAGEAPPDGVAGKQARTQDRQQAGEEQDRVRAGRDPLQRPRHLGGRDRNTFGELGRPRAQILGQVLHRQAIVEQQEREAAAAMLRRRSLGRRLGGRRGRRRVPGADGVLRPCRLHAGGKADQRQEVDRPHPSDRAAHGFPPLEVAAAGPCTRRAGRDPKGATAWRRRGGAPRRATRSPRRAAPRP